MKQEYWLGHSAKEKKRLDAQATLLADPYLAPLLAGRKRVLEIGCGVGSNVPGILKANPKAHYVGIDISSEAVATARARFGGDKRVGFEVRDGARLGFGAKSFDLVFTRLTLWAAASKADAILAEAYRVLAPRGQFHAFEPDDTLLVFWPQKPQLSKLIARWQARCLKKGMNPLIGKELPEKLLSTGFKALECVAHTKTVVGADEAEYRKAVENIRKIYFGRGPEELGLKAGDATWKAAQRELSAVRPGSLMVETYFSVTAAR